MDRSHPPTLTSHYLSSSRPTKLAMKGCHGWGQGWLHSSSLLLLLPKAAPHDPLPSMCWVCFFLFKLAIVSLAFYFNLCMHCFLSMYRVFPGVHIGKNAWVLQGGAGSQHLWWRHTMTWSLWLISSDLPHRGDVPLSTEGGERKKRAFMLPPAGPVTVITDAILPMLFCVLASRSSPL